MDLIPMALTPVTSATDGNSAGVKPLLLSGVLDKFQHEDTTPNLGREFTNVNIVDDLLSAENADELLRDLAITSKSTYSLLL